MRYSLRGSVSNPESYRAIQMINIQLILVPPMQSEKKCQVNQSEFKSYNTRSKHTVAAHDSCPQAKMYHLTHAVTISRQNKYYAEQHRYVSLILQKKKTLFYGHKLNHNLRAYTIKTYTNGNRRAQCEQSTIAFISIIITHTLPRHYIFVYLSPQY